MSRAGSSPPRAGRGSLAGLALTLYCLLGCGEKPPIEPGAQPPITAASPTAGKWMPADAEAAAQVGALPYARGYRPPIDASRGVVLHDVARAYAGFNLVISGHAARAELLDMTGRERRHWAKPLTETFPELAGTAGVEKVDFWRRVQLLEDGSILAIYEGNGVVKLDRASNVVWARRGDFHHDLQVAGDGSVWVLDRTGHLLPRINPTEGVLEDFITRLSPAGQVVDRLSVLEAFERSPYAGFLDGMPREGDILHTNTLEVLDGSLAAVLPAFRAGNCLVSVLTISTLAVIDPETRAVVWALRGPWRKQHQPTVLASGRLLLFDNTGIDRDHARVLEIDPRGGTIAWQYGGAAGEELFSRRLGSVQRLPNGNTLITESERGRAIEVTPDKRIVWDYRSPHRVFEPQELVAALLEVVRLPAGGV